MRIVHRLLWTQILYVKILYNNIQRRVVTSCSIRCSGKDDGMNVCCCSYRSSMWRTTTGAEHWRSHRLTQSHWQTSAQHCHCRYANNRACFRGQPRPYPKGEGPALPNFGVPFNLCVHPLTQNYRIWRGNTYGASGVGSKFRKIFDVPLTFLLCPHIMGGGERLFVTDWETIEVVKSGEGQ